MSYEVRTSDRRGKPPLRYATRHNAEKAAVAYVTQHPDSQASVYYHAKGAKYAQRETAFFFDGENVVRSEAWGNV